MESWIDPISGEEVGFFIVFVRIAFRQRKLLIEGNRHPKDSLSELLLKEEKDEGIVEKV